MKSATKIIRTTGLAATLALIFVVASGNYSKAFAGESLYEWGQQQLHNQEMRQLRQQLNQQQQRQQMQQFNIQQQLQRQQYWQRQNNLMNQTFKQWNSLTVPQIQPLQPLTIPTPSYNPYY